MNTSLLGDQDDARVRLVNAGDRLEEFRSLTDVQARALVEPEHGIFIAEGLTVVRRAVAAGYQPVRALCGQRWVAGMREVLPAGCPILVGDDQTVRGITGYNVHRGALVAFRRPEPLSVSALAARGHRVLVGLEDLKEHTNVGAIARSAAAFGVGGLVLSPTCADPLYRRAIKVSMGTVLRLPSARAHRWPQALEALAATGYTLLALSPDPSGTDIRELATARPPKCVWLLGTEGTGLTAQTLELTTHRIRIPMAAGVNSLNVAAAAAIAFFATAEHGQ